MKGERKMKDQRYQSDSAVNIDEEPGCVTCPKCGGEIGLWTGSILTMCWFCGFHVFKKEAIIN